MTQQQILPAQVVGGVPEPGGAGASLLELGKTSIGASFETLSIAAQYMKKITVPEGGGFLLSIGAYVKNPADSVGELSVGLLSDAAGAPSKVIAVLPHPGQNSIYTVLAQGPRWIMFPLSCWLPAGDYWITLVHPGAAGAVGFDIYYDTGGSDRVLSFGSGNHWIADAAAYSVTDTTKHYSIKAQFLVVA